MKQLNFKNFVSSAHDCDYMWLYLKNNLYISQNSIIIFNLFLHVFFFKAKNKFQDSQTLKKIKYLITYPWLPLVCFSLISGTYFSKNNSYVYCKGSWHWTVLVQDCIQINDRKIHSTFSLLDFLASLRNAAFLRYIYRHQYIFSSKGNLMCFFSYKCLWIDTIGMQNFF